MSEFDELKNDAGFQAYLKEHHDETMERTDDVVDVGETDDAVQTEEREGQETQEVLETRTDTPKTDAEILAEKTGTTVDLAEEALRSGYRFDEYEQTDPRWKSPGEWVRTGELIDKYRRAVKSLDNKNDVINKMIEKFSKKEELAYQRAIKDLEAKRRLAVEEGDTEAFDIADAEIKQHQQELDEFKNLGAQKEVNTDHDAAIDFVKRNAAWYNNDTFDNAQMQKYAIEYENYLVARDPSLGVEDRLRQVELEVKKKFSNSTAFKNTNRDRAPAVGVNEAKLAATAKSVKLTKQQEQMYQTIRQADPKYTREQYLKDME